MEQTLINFPHDKDNRIQKLYYDIDINTIFNRTKLQNVKNKFGKYIDYLNKKYYNDIQPILLELEQRCRKWKIMDIAEERKVRYAPTLENYEKLGIFRRKRVEDGIECNKQV